MDMDRKLAGNLNLPQEVKLSLLHSTAPGQWLIH